MLHFRRGQKEPFNRLLLARIGEEAAARLLTARGYRILERNLRRRRGEIDIIARKGEEIVFVEVKSRSSEDFGSPAEGVAGAKQRRLADLAAGYIAAHFRREVKWRFDIVEVWLTPEGKVQHTSIIPGAFRPE